jgi:hypothetical protein
MKNVSGFRGGLFSFMALLIVFACTKPEERAQRDEFTEQIEIVAQLGLESLKGMRNAQEIQFGGIKNYAVEPNSPLGKKLRELGFSLEAQQIYFLSPDEAGMAFRASEELKVPIPDEWSVPFRIEMVGEKQLPTVEFKSGTITWNYQKEVFYFTEGTYARIENNVYQIVSGKWQRISNKSAARAKPGNLITDEHGFRYVEWPFTFKGLTVGKPIRKVKDVEALFPDNTEEIMKKLQDYLNQHNLEEDDIPVHQFMIFDSQTREARPPKGFFDNFCDYLKIKRLETAELNITMLRDGAMILGLYLTNKIEKNPISSDFTLAILENALDKADLVLKHPWDKKMEIHIWKNMRAMIANGKVINMAVTSWPTRSIATKPANQEGIYVGRLLPWDLLMKLVKNPHLYGKIRRDLQSRGIKWEENQLLLIDAAMTYSNQPYHSWDMKDQFGGPVGLMGQNCREGWSPLLQYLFPGTSIPKEAFEDGFCVVGYSKPGVIVHLSIAFGFGKTIMSRSNFEQIYGATDKTVEFESKMGKVTEAYYIENKMGAAFLNDRLNAFNLFENPIIFPPPDW